MMFDDEIFGAEDELDETALPLADEEDEDLEDEESEEGEEDAI